ncbi:hypothetical protein [Actinomycetospora soli]|uniref:hypothetical protein n=1 Tax=Actinomycetospora soli TaxID=2893887 RepID=UPI001E425DAE|nr:hypothetical protein [Actinomycetospora soli]MCD2187709.1 hypothetical protein [Actinomycetospora soli]
MTPVLGRRAALGVLALAAPAALAACGAPSASALRPVSAGVRLATDWARRPDGTGAVTGDEGAPFRVVSHDAPPPVVRNGGLEAGLPDAHAATYVLADAGADVVRIGATFAVGPGSEAGSLCLATFTGIPLEGPAPRTRCHFVITPERWIYGLIEDPTRLTVLARGVHASPLHPDGTSYAAEVVVTGSTASLSLPDGTTTAVSDPRIATLGGRFACWEFYKDAAGAADVRLVRSWAG